MVGIIYILHGQQVLLLEMQYRKGTMIQITQLKLPYQHSAADLENKIRKTLRLSKNQSLTYRIIKRSIDARKKPELFLVYSVEVSCENESGIVKKAKNTSVSIAKKKGYRFPECGEQKLSQSHHSEITFLDISAHISPDCSLFICMYK